MKPVPQAVYSSWSDVAQQASIQFTSAWKQNPVLTNMLEHVNLNQGIGFLTRIQAEHKLSSSEIVDLCKRNDSVGGAVPVALGPFDPVSPSSLRYIFHACEILSAMRKKGQTSCKIVEVGCGYGGLAFMLSQLAPRFGIMILQYCLYDLPGPQALQKRYLYHQTVTFPLQFPSNTEFGASLKGKGWWLISAYAIGEFERSVADLYLKTIGPHTQGGGGFLVWNTDEISPVVFQTIEQPILVTPEVPQTSTTNRVLQW